MKFGSFYESPLGKMLLLADENVISGCYFVHQKNFPVNLNYKESENQSIFIAKKWLEIYYSGRNPDFSIKYILNGTSFQQCIWSHLIKIPYGSVTTYGEIARKTAESRGQKHLSAQAVGNAVSANPISIFVPCHRVIGTNGLLTGYAGGLEKKISLLELEGNVIRRSTDLSRERLISDKSI